MKTSQNFWEPITAAYIVYWRRRQLTSPSTPIRSAHSFPVRAFVDELSSVSAQASVPHKSLLKSMRTAWFGQSGASTSFLTTACEDSISQLISRWRSYWSTFQKSESLPDSSTTHFLTPLSWLMAGPRRPGLVEMRRFWALASFSYDLVHTRSAG